MVVQQLNTLWFHVKFEHLEVKKPNTKFNLNFTLEFFSLALRIRGVVGMILGNLCFFVDLSDFIRQAHVANCQFGLENCNSLALPIRPTQHLLIDDVGTQFV